MKIPVSKKAQIWITGLLLLVGCNLQAQGQAFDPMSDPQCKIQPFPQKEVWKSSYMWYPGQLAAHMQKLHKEKSKERCSYVGYPGKFNEPIGHAYFKKTMKLGKETLVKWNGAETISCTVNGRKMENSHRSCTLPKGTNTLFFEVRSENNLPCLIIDGEQVSDLVGWQVSLDNSEWNSAETYSMYDQPDKRPDTEWEETVRILPDQYLFLRNTVREGNNLKLGKHGRLIIDFRHLEVGNVSFTATGKSNLSFRVGESPEEVLNEDEKAFEQKAIPSYVLSGIKEKIRLPELALRYLIVECDEPCTLSDIYFDAKIWPVDFLMTFECNDPKMNNLWNAGVATLHTSMHNFYLDGVKRDYLPWSMDAIVSAFAGDYLFGDEQVSRNGLSIALMPPNPKVSDLGIVDYPLHALIGFKQNYLRYGNLRTSLLYKKRIIQMLDFYTSIQDENGFISAKHSTSGFIPGWSTKMGPDGQGTAAYGQIMLYLNFKYGAYFARLWKEKTLAHKYEQRAEALRKSILTHFWDEGQKAFINGYTKAGDKDMRISHHAQYWAILADLFPSQYFDNLFDKVLPSIKYYKENISYEKGYEFLAYVKAGRTRDIFPFLNAVWGEWLDQGYTRFPENFSPYASVKEQLVFYNRPFGLSLCHGGNGVPPVIAVLNGLLGFSQSDRDISEYSLAPQLMDLDWVKARIPVKEGFIKLNIQRTGTSTIDIPAGCVVHLYNKGTASQKKVLRKAGHYEFIYQ